MRIKPSTPFLIGCLLAATSLPAIAADNPFAAGVRPTEPLSPSEQQETFQLPPGFEIELVAAEPDIAKPMNLAFDAQGRLWVSDSYEYPFAAPLDRPGKDAIKVIEDTDGDGRYDRTRVFADGLNIPIGLYPYRNGVIAWSIPYIWYLEDTDGDGQADRRTKLFGPLGYERDTHGMNASFTRGFDGWLYVTHGFNNNTTIRGADGHEFFMNSGNTYRIRLDGSRAERHTYGQVNPFGMALDPLGNLYTSDCHSMPAYLLIRDAYYPSFGKPHDGLGFSPKIMEHSHGSTAIDGVVYYADDQWPTQYRDNVFIGNVMTSRVNRDTLIEFGSGKRAKEEEDFVKTDDPWFRPVHMQFGPDGALYIADFYNRIIGHYEVPLKHPGRDRHRGRIWKVSYTGTPGYPGQKSAPTDLTTLSVAGLFDELAQASLVRRQLALNYLVDEVGEAAIPSAVESLSHPTRSTWQQRVQSLWLLHRLEALKEDSLESAATDPAREVRVHAMRVLSETPDWSPSMTRWVQSGLQDTDRNVQRAAADAMGRQANAEHIPSLLQALEHASDLPFLKHTLRIALRNQLRSPAVFQSVQQQRWPATSLAAIADVAVAIPTTEAATFLIHYLENAQPKPSEVFQLAKHIAKHTSADDLASLPDFMESRFRDQLQRQLALYEAIETGQRERGIDPSDSLRAWGSRLAAQLLRDVEENPSTWTHRPIPGMPPTTLPWILQTRRSNDGDDTSRFLSSLSPGGESFTGTLRSPTFTIPRQLSFYLAGHDGFPEKGPQGRNHVRLRLAADDRVVATAPAPRNDTAHPVRWDLAKVANQEGYLEITDSDDANAFAWLAVGRFQPEVVTLPIMSPQERSRLLTATARLIATLPNTPLYQNLIQALANPKLPPITRAKMANDLSRAQAHPLAPVIAKRLGEPTLTEVESQSLVNTVFGNHFEAELADTVTGLLQKLPAVSQQALADDLSANRAGAELLLTLAEQSAIPPALLNTSTVANRFRAHGSGLGDRRKTLVAGLPALDAARIESIRNLARFLANHPGNASTGKTLFTQACQICHQVQNVGALVGPQLDGIGSRGTERLLEDILDPNRNVDTAFHTLTLTLKNGDVVTGLLRREAGSLIYLVNAAGQEVSVAKNTIQSRELNSRSLMPDNFGELFEPEQWADLVAFLLASGK